MCDLEASLAARDEALRAVRRERSVLLSEIRRLGGTRPAAELLGGGDSGGRGGAMPQDGIRRGDGRRQGGTRPAAELLLGGVGSTPPPQEGCAEGRRRRGGALPLMEEPDVVRLRTSRGGRRQLPVHQDVMEEPNVVQPGSRGRGQRQSPVPLDGADGGRWDEQPEDDDGSSGQAVQLRRSHAALPVQLRAHVLPVWPPRQVEEAVGSPSHSSASTSSSSSSSIWEAATRDAAGKDDGR